MSAPHPNALLQVTELCFSRNDEPVFGPLSFAVNGGEALLVEGANGVGKTTLLRVLAGLLTAQTGAVHIQGARADTAARARAFCFLGHLPGLKADLTALENLAMIAGLQGAREDRSAPDALAKVGLIEHAFAPYRQLSAGQRKRLALARVWRSNAQVWLLDEPYANLDLQGIELVNALIADHVATGGSAVLTSHGAYAAPPVRTRVLTLAIAETAGAQAA